jgi:hypothetical protein
MTRRRRNMAAVKLGSRGGKARARRLTKEQRVEIARKGGIARSLKEFEKLMARSRRAEFLKSRLDDLKKEIEGSQKHSEEEEQ